MNQVAVQTSPAKPTSACSDLIAMAEQELTAFFRAVTESFGSQQAWQSAEDWLNEFMAINGVPISTRELRLLSIKVASELASRMKVNLVALRYEQTAVSRPGEHAQSAGESLP